MSELETNLSTAPTGQKPNVDEVLIEQVDSESLPEFALLIDTEY